MNILKTNQACLFTIKNQVLNEILFSLKISANVHTKISATAKQGIRLARMVSPARDKAKHWHYKILDNGPKAKNVFEKVHRPSRRQIVLNSLFIKNITDVLSTGDAAPEVMGYGIEITRVKVSPCCQILNIYWQVPSSSFSLCEDIEAKLNYRTRAIRAEMISRNLMGKVPHLFFIRDQTNARLAAFEKALKEVEEETSDKSPIVLDEGFLEDVMAFKSPKKEVKETGTESDCVTENDTEDSSDPPPRPTDMKCDVYGLKHNILMGKVMATKKKGISEHQFTGPEIGPSEDKDLFARISGENLVDVDREKLLKQFQIERKKLRSQKREEVEDEDGIQWQLNVDEVEETFVEDYYLEDESNCKS